MSIILTDRFQFAAMKGCLLVEGVHSLNVLYIRGANCIKLVVQFQFNSKNPISRAFLVFQDRRNNTKTPPRL